VRGGVKFSAVSYRHASYSQLTDIDRFDLIAKNDTNANEDYKKARVSSKVEF
jgi:hypothetical protein